MQAVTKTLTLLKGVYFDFLFLVMGFSNLR